MATHTPIHFAHANGLPAQSYNYLFTQLAPHPVSYVPILGVAPYFPQKDWQPMVRQLIASIEQTHGHTPVIGLGHSLGGVLHFYAAQQRPELYERVIILDSPIFHWKKRAVMYIAQTLGFADRVVPPAKKAKKRRQHFESKAAAKASFEQRSFFRAFHPQCLADYITYGLTETADGATLTIPAALELRIFCQTPVFLGDTHMKVPTHYVYSDRYEVLQPDDIAWLKRNFGNTQFVVSQGSHMFPLEKPVETAALVKRIIQNRQ